MPYLEISLAQVGVDPEGLSSSVIIVLLCQDKFGWLDINLSGEGLDPISGMDTARKGLTDKALKTANSGYLARRLVDVVQDLIVSELDCGTVDGIEITRPNVLDEQQETLTERILGLMAMFDVFYPETEDLLVPANTFIGEPGTQLTMRTFHIGGTASKEIEQSSIIAGYPGQITLSGVRTVKNKEGQLMVMGRNGQIGIVDNQGQERERYTLPAGGRLYVQSGDTVEKHKVLAEWDPFQEPFITDVSGVVRFSDIVEGKTYQEKVDENTNRATKTIIGYRSTNYRPSLSLCDEQGNVLTHSMTGTDAVYHLPVGAILMVKDGDTVHAGDVLARKPRERAKIKDIVGGLPRVDDLFEVRKPKDLAVISEIEGAVSFGPDVRGKRKIIITPEAGDQREYLVPKTK